MPTTYIDFDEKAKTVDVEITTDKEEYKPGDKVTVYHGMYFKAIYVLVEIEIAPLS